MKKGKVWWEYIEGFDFMGLVETWVEDKMWEKLIKRLPSGYKWKLQATKREKKKGRANGGILTGVREQQRKRVWYAIKREIIKFKGKLFAQFVDISAAFDTANRRILWQSLERRGVSKSVAERLKEIYEGTSTVIKV
ncbi:hypothetical protein ANTQUA_LOCUS10489, partial [Anthophora quadrimaculata]